jgi:hypothetical protein
MAPEQALQLNALGPAISLQVRDGAFLPTLKTVHSRSTISPRLRLITATIW